MDKNKLLYFIKSNGLTIGKLCESVGMSYTAFYGKCKYDRFLLKEIWKIAELLNLTTEDVVSIFFANMVSK